MSATALVVVSYGSHRLLAHNLPAADACGAEHVVVVDNWTTPAEREAVAALAADRGWDLVAPERNLGFGTGVDVGVARARALGCTTFVLLNPDATAPPGTVAALLRAAADDTLALVGPRIVRSDGSLWFGGAQVLVDAGRTGKADGADPAVAHPWLTGACLAVSAPAWDLVGGFGDDFFLYWEDVDLSWRLRAAGGRLVHRPDLEVVHDAGGTQSGSDKSPVYVRFNCRNRLLFAARNLPPHDVRTWLLRTPAYALEVLRRGGYRRLLHPRSLPLLRAALAGSLAGVRIALPAALSSEPAAPSSPAPRKVSR
ncbi:glycosyltransferase family 2 protein [Cellulomonas aerilata]|uniref:Glycosyltransferase 2-like domain-containing protein n=1 Tax=Cellulomonas aerilata TaxID=515326 RepID=A0A512DDX0_9CELL|nr:glycosyltransferase family 2 protein [Cellulomonas aerilata]GEO34637.1 hypothetical protein CAE01nite_23620 [Cellulomonas aerilata]